MRSVVFILTILISVFSLAQTCDQDKTECAFYCHASEILNCEPSNYLNAFGYRYCRTYLEKQDHFSLQGQAVLKRIRPCLIDFLENQPGLTCSNVKALAVHSHLACYVNSGFCGLRMEDKTLIFDIAKRQAFDVGIMTVMGQILEACEKNRLENLF